VVVGVMVMVMIMVMATEKMQIMVNIADSRLCYNPCSRKVTGFSLHFPFRALWFN
jgi:hypothetical protein